MIVVYVAHCYGGDPAMREAAEQWVRRVADERMAPIADWCILTRLWAEDRRAEGLAIDCALLARCDVMLQVGPRLSDGMQREEAHAHARGVPVVSWVGRGEEDGWADALRKAALVTVCSRVRVRSEDQ